MTSEVVQQGEAPANSITELQKIISSATNNYLEGGQPQEAVKMPEQPMSHIAAPILQPDLGMPQQVPIPAPADSNPPIMMPHVAVPMAMPTGAPAVPAVPRVVRSVPKKAPTEMQKSLRNKKRKLIQAGNEEPAKKRLREQSFPERSFNMLSLLQLKAVAYGLDKDPETDLGQSNPNKATMTKYITGLVDGNVEGYRAWLAAPPVVHVVDPSMLQPPTGLLQHHPPQQDGQVVTLPTSLPNQMPMGQDGQVVTLPTSLPALTAVNELASIATMSQTKEVQDAAAAAAAMAQQAQQNIMQQHMAAPVEQQQVIAPPVAVAPPMDMSAAMPAGMQMPGGMQMPAGVPMPTGVPMQMPGMPMQMPAVPNQVPAQVPTSYAPISGPQ